MQIPTVSSPLVELGYLDKRYFNPNAIFIALGLIFVSKVPKLSHIPPQIQPKKQVHPAFLVGSREERGIRREREKATRLGEELSVRSSPVMEIIDEILKLKNLGDVLFFNWQ